MPGASREPESAQSCTGGSTLFARKQHSSPSSRKRTEEKDVRSHEAMWEAVASARKPEYPSGSRAGGCDARTGKRSEKGQCPKDEGGVGGFVILRSSWYASKTDFAK